MSEGQKKLGRPRADPATVDVPAEEAIIAAAQKLFRQQGYSATSTRQIAAAAGLRQPSLFHYFESKRAIFERIAMLALEPEIDFIEREAGRAQPPDVALYRYVRFVANNLQTNPNVIGSPQRFPELEHEDLGRFQEQYQHIRETLASHVRRGVAAGLFVVEEAEIASQQLFALVEAPLTSPVRDTAKAERAPAVAAGLVLRALLKDPSRLAEVVAGAGPMDRT